MLQRGKRHTHIRSHDFSIRPSCVSENFPFLAQHGAEAVQEHEGQLHLASSPGLQLKAWYRLHARAFCKICRIRIRTDIMGLYVYGQFYGKVYGNLAHAHAVDTRPSLRITEGLGTRLSYIMNGPAPRVHGNKGRRPKHQLTLEQAKDVVQYIMT